MFTGSMLLSKLIDTGHLEPVNLFKLKANDFITKEEKAAFKFLLDYSVKNSGNLPDPRTVATHTGFEYIPEVSDTFQYLVTDLRNYRAQSQIVSLIQGESTEKFKELSPDKWVDWITEQLKAIKDNANTNSQVGSDIVADTSMYSMEYLRRKAGESYRLWKSSFKTFNDTIGGYLSSNMYTWYARPGRGKSIVTMLEGIEAAMQGATVLIWALEMSKYEYMSRVFAFISARLGLIKTTIEDATYVAGFTVNDLLYGRLSDKYEEIFMEFLDNLNEYIPGSGKIIIRALDDEDFYDRSVNQLESDIIQCKADVVILDAIYLMDYEANTSRVAGGDIANTSMKLRRVAGRQKCVLHVITQATEEEKVEYDEDGNRELSVPRRNDIKKTKAVLEDAAVCFGLDTSDGRGLIEISKGRVGYEGTKVEVTYLPSIGLVKEIDLSEIARKFAWAGEVKK